VKPLFLIRTETAVSRHIGRRSDQFPGNHEILFVFDGQSHWIHNERTVPVARGGMLFNPEGALVPANADPLVLGQIFFDEELFSQRVHMEREALYVLGLIKLHAKRGNHIELSNFGIERTRAIFDSMLWEFQNRYRGYSWAIRLKLIELLITVMRDTRFTIPIKSLSQPSSSRMDEIIHYLHLAYMNEVTVEDLLDICHLSRSQFHLLFKKETGKTPLRYLSEIRCQKAAELLVSTDKPITDIAVQCGFDNLSHFYHTFKREKGIAPGRFRQQE